MKKVIFLDIYCQKCGGLLGEQDFFCGKCGEKRFSKQDQNSQIARRMTVCPICKTEMTMISGDSFKCDRCKNKYRTVAKVSEELDASEKSAKSFKMGAVTCIVIGVVWGIMAIFEAVFLIVNRQKLGYVRDELVSQMFSSLIFSIIVSVLLLIVGFVSLKRHKKFLCQAEILKKELKKYKSLGWNKAF